MSFTDFRKLDQSGFTEKFGALYEHSPWVAAAAFDQFQKDQSIGTIEEFHGCFVDAVKNASEQRQLRLLNAHPQLAVARSEKSALTANSQSEQAGAGLDQCNEAEYLEFETLNDNYLAKFGFPFIIAVKGLDRERILRAFRDRITNKPSDEFRVALMQVCKIGRFRLELLFDGATI